jgi:N-acetylglucosaminyldiphosphoundecaprenol N-acetyl-beta-D-mannosaminyltransferase
VSALRILVATDQWFPDRASGSARVAAETARRLADRGHEVTVIAPASAGRPREEHEGTLRLVRALRRTPLPQTFVDVAAARAAASRLGTADVVLAHQPTVALGTASALPHVPLVSVFHASPALEARYVAERRPVTRAGVGARALAPVLAQLERAALRRSARILVLSEYSESLVLGRHPWAESQLTRVSGGVDTDWFAPGDGVRAARDRLGFDPDAPLLVCARRLEPRMGLDLLLDALRDVPTVRLGLAGTGSLDGTLRGRAAELGVADRVVFLGRVSEEELRDWYRAADVVVMPTAAYEGFGLATAEALACGAAVVGTPVGATPELLRPLDPRLVAAAPESGALAAAVATTLERVGDEFRERCREYACERFAWDSVIDAWEAALLDAASERARAHLFGLRLDALSVSDVVARIEGALADRRPLTHASVNAAKAVRAQKDIELRTALHEADLVTADGQPVVWAARLAGRRLPERVAGIDLMEEVLELADRRAYRVYLLGARPDVAAAAAAEIRRRYPRAKIVGAQDGYFDPADESSVVERIAAAAPDIIFVALGTPEKELFQVRHRDALDAAFIMGVGGAFDVLAGRRRRAPRWAQRAGLEWAFRLAQEPRRLLRRYVVGNAQFVALTAREVLRTRTSHTEARS